MYQISLYIVILFALAAHATPNQMSCFYDTTTNKYVLKPGKDANSIAWGTYYDELSQTGWGRLYISGNPKIHDHHLMYCAGYLEGSLTTKDIYNWWQTFQVTSYGESKVMPAKLHAFLQKQTQWARSEAEKNSNSDPYWNHLRLLYKQFDGLLAGYNDNCPQDGKMDEVGMYAFNAAGDLETLLELFGDPEVIQSLKLKSILKYTPPPALDCSGLVKVAPGNSELYVGHTTWTDYYSMYRIFKMYNLPLKAPQTSSYRVAFSSRAGFLNSKDDFYVMKDSNMVSLETTNGIYNKSLYDAINPQTLLTFQRVIIANRMANSGQEWTEIFSRYNSGTYNNQWMVVDYKLFQKGSPIKPNTLWIVEQIPGYTESADVSDILKQQTFWPSYNVPYFAFIYNISGYQNGSSQNGQGSLYVNDPRARIFAREQLKVTDLDGMKHIMQYNDYLHDPLSQGSPANAISSRYDLRTSKPVAFGGIDSKIASVELLEKFSPVAISGPTHQSLPPFQWDPSFSSVPHDGQPNLWNFTWITVHPHH